jgi:hypothetical protein
MVETNRMMKEMEVRVAPNFPLHPPLQLVFLVVEIKGCCVFKACIMLL